MATIARSSSAAVAKPPLLRRLAISRRRVGLWATLWLGGAACELVALWPVVFGDRGSVTAADVVFRLTGGSFIAAGLIAWQRRPLNRSGRLMVATGFLFFLQPLASRVDSSLVQTAGLVFTDYWTIAFVVLLLAFPDGRRVRGRAERCLVVAFAIPLVVMQPVWLLFVEQPGMANALGFWPNDRAADWLDKGQRGLLLGATLSLFLFLAWRWRQASPPLRRVLLPVLAGGATMLSFGAMLALDLINGTRSDTALLVTAFVLASVPVAFLAGVLRSRLARVAVSDLMVELHAQTAPADTREALARALGDPSLTLAYWLPQFGTYVDLDGRPVELDAYEDQAATLVDGDDGSPIAALLHDPALRNEPELLEAVAAAAAIAVDNARLHADLRARLAELKGSRARIVEAGQKERQRLERNLHDGAQQRLVALSLELGMLEGQMASDPATKERLAGARREIAASLEELRELARGLHPAVVSGHGLDVALEQLAARAPVPVKLSIDTDGRLPEALEVAAFYLVSESLANVGKYARASAASVEVSRNDGRLVVEVVDDGCGGADTERGSGLRGLADRVEALDGRLRVWSPLGGGTRVRAELPCG
jgi:signal transduction histidine kinase